MSSLRSLALVAFLTTLTSLSAEGPLKVGETAPEFSLSASDGKSYATKDFLGKKTLIVAWFPRAFTPGCTKQCKSMKEGGEILKGYDIAYFTASCDPVQKNAEFAKELGLDYPILSDPNGEVAKKFGIYNADRNTAARVTFIIGADGKVLAVDDKVQTENHAKEIVEHLEQLGVKKK
jgi:peroxiredoxin Q/BCP